MAGLISVIEPGLASTVQDAGRPGYRRLGVPVSGALDACWLACANALVGNPAGAAALECRLAGPQLRIEAGPVRVALAGQASGMASRADGRREALQPWRSLTLDAGDALQVGAIGGGVAYLAFSGGLRVPEVLGSRSTYVAAALGGLSGRALKHHDVLPCGLAPGGADLENSAPALHEGGALRVLGGPQQDAFTATAIETLNTQSYRVTRHADRMGMRLDGPPLAFAPGAGADIVSDAVTPGALQVPADGRPIVLLADCQTVGGYAKIATVIRADLPRLAHLRSGETLRFSFVDRAAATMALRQQARRLDDWIASLHAARPRVGLDQAMLYSSNLISGMVDATADPYPACRQEVA